MLDVSMEIMQEMLEKGYEVGVGGGEGLQGVEIFFDLNWVPLLVLG